MPNPCLNGATCVSNGNDYTCMCASGFEGVNCEVAGKIRLKSIQMKTFYISGISAWFKISIYCKLSTAYSMSYINEIKVSKFMLMFCVRN